MSAVNPTPLVIHLSNTHSIYSEFHSHRTKMFHNLVLGLNSFLKRLHSSENLMHEDKLGGHEPHLHLVHDPLSDTLQNTQSEMYISNRNCSEKCLSGFFCCCLFVGWDECCNLQSYSAVSDLLAVHNLLFCEKEMSSFRRKKSAYLDPVPGLRRTHEKKQRGGCHPQHVTQRQIFIY